MLSYRKNLTKIGISRKERVSYLGFTSRPKSLRAAIRSMEAPASGDWKQVSDIFRDDDWTDEVQGVAWNGTHWIFVADAHQNKPGSEDKAIYVFSGGRPLGDDKWVNRLRLIDIPHPIRSKESDSHWGQLTYHDGFVYVSHFWVKGPKKDVCSAVVFKSNGGSLSFDRWVELENPTREPRVEFQTINPWDGLLYSQLNNICYLHDPYTGKFTGKTLKLQKAIPHTQGACFSANGHLYLSSNKTHPAKGKKYQTIWYFSALNGHYFGVIPVLAEEEFPDQELEGVCYADLKLGNGQRGQIHTVLLENPLTALDNIFLKSFAVPKNKAHLV